MKFPFFSIAVFCATALVLSCGDSGVSKDPYEVIVHVELPAPLSDEVGIPVSPDSVLRFSGDVSIDLTSISDNLDDVTNIVVAIIPAYVSFDTTETPNASSRPATLHSAQLDSAITVTLYLAGQGTTDPFQEASLAAVFYIDIEGEEVTGVSGAVSVPPSLKGYILSGSFAMGALVESKLLGRLVVRMADLIFTLQGE